MMSRTTVAANVFSFPCSCSIAADINSPIHVLLLLLLALLGLLCRLFPQETEAFLKGQLFPQVSRSRLLFLFFLFLFGFFLSALFFFFCILFTLLLLFLLRLDLFLNFFFHLLFFFHISVRLLYLGVSISGDFFLYLFQRFLFVLGFDNGSIHSFLWCGGNVHRSLRHSQTVAHFENFLKYKYLLKCNFKRYSL